MATEPPKTSSANPDHSFPQMAPYPPPQHASSGTYPPPGSYAQFYPYPPHPPEGNNSGDANNANATLPGPPFVVPYPPPPHGMLYTFSHPPPPGQGYSPYPQPVSPSRPKRKQVKMACTNCAAACKRCDEHRPCERCTKYGLTESCVDGQRKERKKGIKRGPYKRRKKSNSAESIGNYPPQPGEGEWQHQNSQAQTPNPAVNTAPAMHPVAQYPPPEGYPYYYPPPGYMPPMNDGQPSHEGAPNVNSPPQPILPYYIHPGSYPPFSYYPHPGPGAYGHPPPPPAHILDHPSEAQKKGAQGGADGVETGPSAQAPAPTPAPVKKRTRTAKSGEGKAKKGKAAAVAAGRLQKGNKTGEAGEVENQEHEEAAEG